MAVSTYVRTEKIGDVALTIISDGELRWSVDQALDVPEAQWAPVVSIDERRRLTLGMNVVHLAVHGRSILIDTGLGDPDDPWNAGMNLGLSPRRTAGVIAGLATIGIQPEDVDLVVYTHNHGDHITGTTTLSHGERTLTFPRARHLIHRADWEQAPARQQPDSLLNRHFGPVVAADRLDLAEGVTELAPHVSLVPAPGESPGHAIVRVQSDGETAYFLGDLFHLPSELSHPDWMPANRDRVAMTASRDRLIAAALEENALLVTAHMLYPGLGRIGREGAGFVWQAV